MHLAEWERDGMSKLPGEHENNLEQNNVMVYLFSALQHSVKAAVSVLL